jgi:hypothetical protein
MSRFAKWIFATNLAAIAVLVFVFAELMISPGKLIDGHRALETDCFTCHTVFLGASSQKCVSCHKVADIGVMTTRGLPVSEPGAQVAFHQKLVEQDCVACHSDHEGVAKYRIFDKFTHSLLDAATRETCTGCHQQPADPLHQQVSNQCQQCHDTDAWKPSTFRHDLLAAAEREPCLTCHKAVLPSDDLHRQVSEACGQCHGTDAWKPATFDHRKYFVFDRDHPAECTTCHTTASYKEYTCYGCHEHSERNVRGEHLEEGIRNFETCTDCHRSANEDEAERAWRSIQRGVPYRFDTPQPGSGGSMIGGDDDD